MIPSCVLEPLLISGEFINYEFTDNLILSRLQGHVSYPDRWLSYLKRRKYLVLSSVSPTGLTKLYRLSFCRCTLCSSNGRLSAFTRSGCTYCDLSWEDVCNSDT